MTIQQIHESILAKAGNTKWAEQLTTAVKIDITNPTIVEELELRAEKYRVEALWQSAYDYEREQISGSAIGLLAMGVMQGKPKCLAIQNWIKSIWTEYYTRKANGSTNYDFSVAGICPHTVPELMVELGL